MEGQPSDQRSVSEQSVKIPAGPVSLEGMLAIGNCIYRMSS